MIRALAMRLLASPPVWPLLRRRVLKTSDFTILCYHTLGPDTGGVNGWTVLRSGDFRAQLVDLQKHYEIVSLDDALAGHVTARPPLVITFDDGDLGLSRYLPPILSETPVPVTLYVATAQFETGQPFWFDRVVNALQGPGRIELPGLGVWQLPGTGDKAHWAALGPILQTLKQADADRREGLADQLVSQGTAPPDPALGPMGRDALAELAAMPGVTIGAHTHGHELLDQIPADAARASIQRSRGLLQDWTGQPVHHFAFPNGNYTQDLLELVEDLGFASATILEERPVPREVLPFALPRISVGRYDSLPRLRLRLAGV